eukprot:TRINITY_DN17069_c0_g1_i1.p1 TRINITY_DN17069_c0_g1~~TRINITY_DN17069_c0_g1_i1.p1  ORF type:complete len:539 (+),score=56.09 TRINITY_DN17069_c0_g1_i1:206-1618(+)
MVGDWTSFGFSACYNFSDMERGFISSINIIGALIASFCCFVYADSIGRKSEVQLGATCMLFGAMAVAASPALWSIVVGFGLYGVGIGFSMHVAPIYIAELSPPEIRGALISAKELMIVFGMFLGYLAGYVFGGMLYFGWRLMIVSSCVPSLMMLIGISAIPDSPRYLVLCSVRGASTQAVDGDSLIAARRAVRFFHNIGGANSVEEELLKLRSGVVALNGQDQAKWTDCFKYRWPMVIGCGIVFLQQVTGQPSVLYFSNSIFLAAGLRDKATLASVALGFVKLLATLISVTLVDKFGRRTLLFVGISMMAVGLVVLSSAYRDRHCADATLNIKDCPPDQITTDERQAMFAPAALMLYVSGYQVGFGPIAWTLISEIFPATVRGAASATAAIVNFSANAVVTLTLRPMLTWLSPSGLFFCYFLWACASLVFVYAVVPETRGKTLEEIQADVVGPSTPLMQGHRVSTRTSMA